MIPYSCMPFRKKTTGRHYALKIQTKVGLLRNYADVISRMQDEKRALAACHHPFIVSMDYAFQTPSLVIMALELGTGENLYDSLVACPDHRMDEGRVRFYAAEIALALAHIHRLGWIYRDLKPHNVLLNADGHVQLIDMGAVIDIRGDKLKAEADAEMPIFAENADVDETYVNQYIRARYEGSADAQFSAARSGSDRARSVIGTRGYMAPEVMALKHDTHATSGGYTNSVDWWSLGITIAKLITGHTPFGSTDVSKFILHVHAGGTITFDATDHCVRFAPEYARFFQNLRDTGVSAPAINVMQGLLCLDGDKRLGSGNLGMRDLRCHEFFAGIDWDLLEHKRLDPPFLPQPKVLVQTPIYESCDDVLEKNSGGHWKNLTLSGKDNEVFLTW